MTVQRSRSPILCPAFATASSLDFVLGVAMPDAIPTVEYGGLPPGARLDRYLIKRLIASGGFGITYEVEHATLGGRFAMKEHFPRQFAFRSGTSVQPNASEASTFTWSLDRFIDEGKKLTQFNNPAIVTVSDIFRANGTAYLVMDYIDGISLSAWLEKLKRPLSEAELDKLLVPLLDALEHVHAAEFLHRDIAPDNILVKADGTPCLIDFGAARQAMGQYSKTLTAIVKAGYSPIEQYDTEGHEGQGAWSDIYALGATLYQAVTGTRPPEAPGRLIKDKLVPAATAAEGRYSFQLLRMIDLSLKVLPHERPQSIAHLRQALAAKGDDASDEATSRRPPPVPPESIPPPGPAVERAARRRHSAWATGALLLVLVAAVGGAGTYFFTTGGERTADAEYLKIATTSDIATLDDFRKKHPGTQAAQKAEARKVVLQQQQREQKQIEIAAEDRDCQQRENLQLGIRACSAMLARNPNNASAYNNRGNAYGDLKDYDRAIADLTQSIRVDPGFALAYYNRARILRIRNDLDRALADASESIRLNRNFALSPYIRGLVHTDLKNYDSAIADLTDAINLDPKLALAFGARGRAYQLKRDYNRAIVDYTEAIRVDPSYALAYNNRGTAYENKGDQARAIADYRRALEIAPNHELALGNLRRLGLNP